MPFADLRQMAVSGTPILDAGGAIYNVKAYGAIGDGVADDTTAILAANTAAQNGGTIEIPPGIYRVTKTIPVNSNQRWHGTFGASIITYDASTISGLAGTLFSHTDGTVTFRTVSDVTFDSLLIRNTHAGITAYGLNIGFSDHIPNQISIRFCEFDHCACNVAGGNRHFIFGNIVHDSAGDRGIGCTSSQPGVVDFDNINSHVAYNKVYNCSGVGINGGNCLGLEVFSNIVVDTASTSYCIDVNSSRDTLVEGNYVNGTNGINFEQDQGTGGTISAVNNTVVGTSNASGQGIAAWPNLGSGTYALIHIEGNRISNINVGVFIGQESVANVFGNTYTNIGSNAVKPVRNSGNYTKVTIHDETVNSFGQAAAGQPAIFANSQNIYAHNNHIDGTGATTPIGFYGLGASSEIVGNTLLNIAAGSYWQNLSGVVRIAGNSNGTQPIPSSITVTASVFTYTNNDVFDEQVTVQGGTVSVISVRGVTVTNAISGQFYLHPNDTIAVTYTVAPAMFKIPV